MSLWWGKGTQAFKKPRDMQNEIYNIQGVPASPHKSTVLTRGTGSKLTQLASLSSGQACAKLTGRQVVASPSWVAASRGASREGAKFLTHTSDK